MPLTFLALENPLGLLGTKIQGEINVEAQLKPLEKLKKGNELAATFKIGYFTKQENQIKTHTNTKIDIHIWRRTIRPRSHVSHCT
jgi:hypothetical protein